MWVSINRHNAQGWKLRGDSAFFHGKVSKRCTCPLLSLPVLSFGKVPKIFTCPPQFFPVPDRRTVSNFHPWYKSTVPSTETNRLFIIRLTAAMEGFEWSPAGGCVTSAPMKTTGSRKIWGLQCSNYIVQNTVMKAVWKKNKIDILFGYATSYYGFLATSVYPRLLGHGVFWQWIRTPEIAQFWP